MNPKRREPRKESGILSIAAWGSVGLLVLILASPHPDDVRQLGRMMSSLLMAHCAWAFWSHGGARISAPGAYSLTLLAFGGFAGWWWMDRATGATLAAIVDAVTILFFIQAVTYGAFWHTSRHSDPAPHSRTLEGREKLPKSINNVAIILLILGLVASPFGGRYLVFGGAAVFVALAFLSVRLASGQEGKFRLGPLLFLSTIILTYLAVLFEGYGRLNVVSLLLVPAVAYSIFVSDRRLKFTVLVGGPIAIAFLNTLRRQADVARFGTFNENEVGSTYSPLLLFARLFAEQGSYPRGNGETFIGSVLFFVPRSVWSSKPQGFGFDLTDIFAPHLKSVGQSMAGMSAGEFVYNFGTLGLLLYIPVVGILVRTLDKFVVRQIAVADWGNRSLGRLSVLVLVIAGLPDFVWNGASTFSSRTGIRVAIALTVVLMMRRMSPSDEKRNQASAPPDTGR